MDLRDFFNGEFKIKYCKLGEDTLVVEDATIEIRTQAVKNIKIKYHPKDDCNDKEKIMKKAWKKATGIKLSLCFGIICGELGGAYKGRRFCISIRDKVDDSTNRKIYCFLEPWHRLDAQDDGEWHGSTG